jgi:hypothetical protein
MGQRVPPRAGRRGRKRPTTAEVARVINVRNPWAPIPHQLTEPGDRGARASWPVAHRLAGKAFCRREHSQTGLTRRADMPDGMARGWCGAWRDAALVLASASDLCMGRMGV